MTVGGLHWSLVALAIRVSVSAARLDEKVRGFDHVHFHVPDENAAEQWYRTRPNGMAGEDPIRVVFDGMPYNGHGPQPVQLTWYRSEAGAKPVSSGAIDNIGFSFANLDAKVKGLAAAGVRIIAPVRKASKESLSCEASEASCT